jgi:PIN domain nuclease of toxin-antitoxin system
VSALLLDTHVLLWFVFGDNRLSSRALECIEARSTTVHLSTISLWEIVIKTQIGKLGLGMPVERFFRELLTGRDLELVDLELSHLIVYEKLPLLHRDPFDRLLVAQAKVLGVPLLSADAALGGYDIEIIW